MSSEQMDSKSERPSRRWMQRARRQGAVPVSRQALAAAALLAGGAALAVSGPALVGRLLASLRGGLASAAAAELAPGEALRGGLQLLLGVTAPVLVAATLAVLLVGLVQTGGLLTLAPLRPDPGRLLPGGGGPPLPGQRLMRLLRLLLVAAGVGWAALSTLRQSVPSLLATLEGGPEATLQGVAGCLGSMALRLGLVLLVLAAVDLVYQRSAHARRLRQTRRQRQREQRELSGDPGLRLRRRRLHLQAVQRPRGSGS